jgi:hypothetical protein
MTDLEKIALALRADAAQSTNAQCIRHTLERGLRLGVRYCRGDWHLGLWRENVAPGDEEVRLCREAFQVPPDALTTPPMRHGTYIGFILTWTGPARVRQRQPAGLNL